MEAALKLARQYWVESGRPEKQDIISLSPGYHGNTLLALSASARPHYATFFREWIVNVHRVPAPLAYRCACRGADAECRVCSGMALEDKILEVGAHRIAAFIAEPVGGSSTGASVPRDDYWRTCARHLRSPRRALHRRRSGVRGGAYGDLVRARALRRGAGHHDDGQGDRGRLRAALRSRRAAPHHRRARARLRVADARADLLASPGALRRGARDAALHPRARARRASGRDGARVSRQARRASRSAARRRRARARDCSPV